MLSPDLILAFPGVDLLRSIGQVLHFSAQGHIIAQLKNAIRLGTRLYSSASQPIGRVVDVFGPTVKPYAAVKPDQSVTPDKLPAGSSLFLGKGTQGGVRKRRKK